MEAEKNKAGNMNSVLRQALERRQTEHLSSNFSYRMMERVRLEAESKNWLDGIADISFLVVGIWHLLFIFLSEYQLYRLFATDRCTTRFFFVKVLCLHCFTGINLIGNR